MADWQPFVAKVEHTVGVAKDYLSRRAAGATNPAEKKRLNSWYADLDKAFAEVKASTDHVVQVETPILEIYSKGLDSSYEQIGRLHEYYDYSGVEFVVSGLHQHLLAMAGPHGPGKGKPGDR